MAEKEYMQPIEDGVENQVGYSLQLSHTDSINARYSPNNYDQTYFPGFKIGTIDYKNYIEIPDVGSVDTTQTLVVVPVRNWEVLSREDTVTGFYYDAVAGQLDSLELIGEEPPTSSYYIWVVHYDHLIEPFKKTIKRDVEPGCGNGYCEGFAGEDATTCPTDCDSASRPIDPSTGAPEPVERLYNIKVKEVNVYGDHHQYVESWVSGRYDFWASGCLYSDREIEDSEGELHLGVGELLWTEPVFLGKIKRKDVCRYNKNNVAKNCPSTPLTPNENLYENVLESDTVMFIGFEGRGRMPGGRGEFNAQEFFIGDSKLKNPDLPGMQNLYLVHCHRNNKSTMPHYLKSMSDDNSPYPNWYNTNSPSPLPMDAIEYDRSDIITVADFNSVTKEYVFDNGEMRITLELIE